MPEKVEVKDSSALKRQKLLKERESRSSCRYSRLSRFFRLFRLTIFCMTACCIFVVYWFILTPQLGIKLVSHTLTHPRVISYILYWFVAFLIWLLIMICLMLIWKYCRVDEKVDVTLQSYGTNDIQKSKTPIDNRFDLKHNTKSRDGKESGPLIDSISDKHKTVHDQPSTNISEEYRRNRVKKHKDLPPLVIHRRNSGNGIEHVGTVSLEKNVDKQIETSDKNVSERRNDKEQEAQRKSTKDCLKLTTTVTPQDELGIMSPKRPLSPRELFFIDLIREAEKAERNDPPRTEGKHFFPGDFSPTKRDVNRDAREERKPAETQTDKEQEAVYFIADVESPKSEKTEVFLEIAPDPEPAREWSVNVNDKKPALVLRSGSTNDGDKSTENKVVLFDV